MEHIYHTSHFSKYTTSYVPVDWNSFMVAKGEVGLLAREVLLHQGRNCAQDEELVITRLIPDIMSRKISSHIHKVKLEIN